MRKLYILRRQEDDGALLDALEARGLGPDDITNPNCPTCGADTYVAYTAGEAFLVITWDGLDPDDEEDADEWFLVCSEPGCPYEEQVERVVDPAGAETFDLEVSERGLDEFLGFMPLGLRQLIEFLQQMDRDRPNRKLECLVDAAQWRYDSGMEGIRQWLSKLPEGKRIHFDVEGESMKGTFMAATQQGLLAITNPGGELVAVSAESLSGYGPLYFDPTQEDEEEIEFSDIDPDRVVWVHGGSEYVVIRGHHMRLAWTEERLGVYKVSTQDEAVARDLDLRQTAERWWEGWFRRHEIDARYDIQRLVLVRGHWLVKWGEAKGGTRPAVICDDPAVAAELGLEPVRGWRMDDRPESEMPIAHWSGTVDSSEVADQREMRLYHWPIPDAAVGG